MTIKEDIAGALADYLAKDLAEGPFSDTAFVRAEVEADGMVSLFTSESDAAWPVASFDAPQLAEWIVRSPLLNRVRAEAIRDATRVFAEGGWIDTFTAGVVDDVTAVQAADRWFTAHAATIEQNSEGNET